MIHATLGRWGKSLALRLTPEIAGGLRLREGDRVEIVSGPDEIVIRRARPRFTREDRARFSRRCFARLWKPCEGGRRGRAERPDRRVRRIRIGL